MPRFYLILLNFFGPKAGHFCLSLAIVMKDSICLTMPTVARETHIPQSAVHVNCFIPPALLLLLLARDTIDQV